MAEKPPLGLRPKWIYDQSRFIETDKLRSIEILEAMMRYAEVQKPIPFDWIRELEQLCGGDE